MTLLSNGQTMVIATRVYLDKIEGFRNESFLPEELLLALNKGQFRLLDNLIDKNFQQGTIRYEWIRPFEKDNLPGGIPAFGTGETAISAFPTATPLYYFVSAKAIVQLSTETFSKYGTSNKCLADIPYPPGTVLNPVLTTEQLQVHETGTAQDRESNSFYGMNYRNPRAELQGTGLLIYRGPKFIVTGVTYDYIAKPVAIGNTTDALAWPESALQKIVDYAVEYLRLTIEDPSWQANMQDMQVNTHNPSVGR